MALETRPSGSTSLWVFDESIHTEAYEVVAAVDEAGRGCLAGPVVAAAVLLPRDFRDDRIRDSKQLTARMREVLFDVIAARAVSYGIGPSLGLLTDWANRLRAAMSIGALVLLRRGSDGEAAEG